MVYSIAYFSFIQLSTNLLCVLFGSRDKKIMNEWYINTNIIIQKLEIGKGVTAFLPSATLKTLLTNSPGTRILFDTLFTIHEFSLQLLVGMVTGRKLKAM